MAANVNDGLVAKDIPRKEEFQKYLEKAGVIDQLTKLLVNLYENPDRPENAIDYIRTFLGGMAANANDDTKELHNRIADLEKQLHEKDLEIARLKEERGDNNNNNNDESQNDDNNDNNNNNHDNPNENPKEDSDADKNNEN